MRSNLSSGSRRPSQTDPPPLYAPAVEQSAALLDDDAKERIDEAGANAVKDLDASSKVVEA